MPTNECTPAFVRNAATVFSALCVCAVAIEYNCGLGENANPLSSNIRISSRERECELISANFIVREDDGSIGFAMTLSGQHILFQNI